MQLGYMPVKQESFEKYLLDAIEQLQSEALSAWQRYVSIIQVSTGNWRCPIERN